MDKRTTTFVVFGWARWLIYLGAGLAIAAATARFISYPTPEYTTAEKLPSLLVPGAWGFAGVMLYHYRARWLARFIWTTAHGVQVWGEQQAREWLALREIMVEEILGDVMAWWREYFIRTGQTDAGVKMAAWFATSNLEVAVSEEGVGDPRHGIRNKAGLAYPKRLVLNLRPGELTSSSGGFFATLAHEASHECLLAMGIANDDEEQHRFMRAAGCPYA